MAAAAPIPVDENGNPIAASVATAGAESTPIPVDENGDPITSNGRPGESSFTRWMNANAPSFLQPANVHTAADLPGRVGARVVGAVPNLVATIVQSGPALQRASADQVSAETGGNYSGDAEAAAAPPVTVPWLPSEAVIKGLGIEMGPNAGPAMKTADTLLPWLIPTGNQLTRVQEAAGPFNKVMTGLRSGAGAVADWALSDAAQQYAQEHGFGPLATTIAGMVGGGVRTPATRLVSSQAERLGTPESGEKFDVNKALLPPEGSTTSTVPPFRDVADPTSSIASILSGASVVPFSGTGEAGAVKAQKGAIARTADAALQRLDPGTTSVLDAGPSSLRQEGSVLANQSRDAIMNQEQRLMDESNAIEGQIGAGRMVDAAPLRNVAAQLAGDKTVGETVRAQAQNVLDTLDKSIDANGQIAYGALKNERSTFNQYLDGLTTASTGDPSIRNTLARTLSPIKDAMTASMADAANQAGVGQQWAQNDAGWTLQSIMKRNLANIGGVLTPDRTDFDPSPGGKQVGKIISNAVEGTGKGGTAPIQQIETGLGEQPARSAVAEAVAALGQPKNPKGAQDFQPSTFGEGVQARIDPDVMDYIEAKAGPGARMNLENAGAAGAGASQPMQQGNLRRMIGAIAGAVPYVGTAGAVFHPAAAALSPLITSMSNDPDFIRAVANRNRPLPAGQIATRAGLGAVPAQPIHPLDLARQGAGAIISGAPSVASTILNYVRPPAAGGQR